MISERFDAVASERTESAADIFPPSETGAGVSAGVCSCVRCCCCCWCCTFCCCCCCCGVALLDEEPSTVFIDGSYHTGDDATIPPRGSGTLKVAAVETSELLLCSTNCCARASALEECCCCEDDDDGVGGGSVIACATRWRCNKERKKKSENKTHYSTQPSIPVNICKRL